jgi:predicted RNA-binding protein with PUA-like domain
MDYWLFKSEPSSWSWEQQKAKGKAGEEWTGCAISRRARI